MRLGVWSPIDLSVGQAGGGSSPPRLASLARFSLSFAKPARFSPPHSSDLLVSWSTVFCTEYSLANSCQHLQVIHLLHRSRCCAPISISPSSPAKRLSCHISIADPDYDLRACEANLPPELVRIAALIDTYIAAVASKDRSHAVGVVESILSSAENTTLWQLRRRLELDITSFPAAAISNVQHASLPPESTCPKCMLLLTPPTGMEDPLITELSSFHVLSNRNAFLSAH
jgi:hypothetical protein